MAVKTKTTTGILDRMSSLLTTKENKKKRRENSSGVKFEFEAGDPCREIFTRQDTKLSLASKTDLWVDKNEILRSFTEGNATAE